VAKSDDKFMVQAVVISQEYFNEYLQNKDEKAVGAGLQQLWQVRLSDSAHDMVCFQLSLVLPFCSASKHTTTNQRL
jgi:hypothetical protein